MDMEMTEPFATKAAAVAPVVLIAAAIEIAVYQRTMESVTRQMA